VIARHVSHPEGGLIDLYQGAGPYGTTAFSVALGLTLDRPWERDLVLTYARAAYACGWPADITPRRTAAELDAIAHARLSEESLAPLWYGTLRVPYDANLHDPWFAA
jgi:hypothetical protein